MHHTVDVVPELRSAVHALMLPILSRRPADPAICNEIQVKISHLSEFAVLARTYIERDNYTRVASGVPVTESNTRLPQQLCQLARGSALLDERAEANQEDYDLVCRAAFDSVPPGRIAVLGALQSRRSPHSLGLPKATVERAIDDLKLAQVLTTTGELSEETRKLLAAAGVAAKGS
jgi:hypothetical protein